MATSVRGVVRSCGILDAGRFLGAFALFLTLTIGLCSGVAQGAQVTLAWDPNTDPELAGYKVHYGTTSGTYGTTVDVGTALTLTATGLTEGTTYYFAATAYDTVGNESVFSNEVTYTVPGIAEINLVGNGVSISDGDTTPAAADHTDFGSADIAAGTVTRTFTIQNTGSGTLTISGSPLVAISGANAADFTVTALPAASVAAGAITTFQVTFDPSAAGVRTATISVANNDANENPYDFAVQGTGAAPPAPDMNLLGNNNLIADGSTAPVTTNDTDFDKTKLSGGTVTKTYTIRNNGAGPLVLSGSPLVVVGGANPADFVVSVPPAASVAPGASTTFVVTFDPSADGTRNAVISITNNDANKNAYDFAVKGRGIAPPKAPKNVRSSQ